MGQPRRKFWTLGLMFLVAACGSPPNAGSPDASSARQESSSSASAQTKSWFGHLPPATSPQLTSPLPISCSGDVGTTDPVAIVTVKGETHQVLRDYVDAANPRTFCSFGDSLYISQILDPHHVLVSSGGAQAIVELPSARVFEIGVNGLLVSVASDLSQVLWISSTDPPTLHDSWDTGDNVIQEYLPPIGGRCGGFPVASAFSRDSKYAFVIRDDPPDQTLLNVVGDRKGVYVVKPPPGGWGPNRPTMAVWSPADKLYYMQQGSIWTWTATGGASQLRQGLTWSWPAVSGDGKHLAYVQWAPNYTNPTVHLMNPETGADLGQIGAGPRFLPMFLTNDLIWMRVEGGGCGPSQPASYIYDLRDKSESPSKLDWVWMTWPSTSARGG